MTTDPTNDADASDVLHLARDEDGHWVTIRGTHVLIKDGRIAKGPSHLEGKSIGEASSSGHHIEAIHGSEHPKGKAAVMREHASGQEHEVRIKAGIVSDGPDHLKGRTIRDVTETHDMGTDDHPLPSNDVHAKAKAFAAKLKAQKTPGPFDDMAVYNQGERGDVAGIATPAERERFERLGIMIKPKKRGTSLAIEDAFTLAADAELKPAITLDSRLPTEHNGLPIHHRWVRATVGGDWKHPVTGQTVSITPDRVNRWAKNLKAARSAGLDIPASTSHKNYKDPRNTLGFVYDARLADNELELLTGYIGDDSLSIAAKNKVSIGVEPNVRDARGNVYDELITHLASTPTPVLPGLPGFVTLSRGEPTEADSLPLAPTEGVQTMDPALKARVTQYLGDNATEDVNEVIPLLLGEIDKLKPEAAKAQALSTELADVKSKLSLSNEPETPADPRVASLQLRAYKADVAADVASGAYSKATGDLLLSRYADEKGNPSALLLSTEDAAPDATFDFLRKLAKSARPGKEPGEVTKGQSLTLNREVPDAAADRPDPIADGRAAGEDFQKRQLQSRGAATA